MIGILGVVHDEALREKYNFSLNRIKDIILEFNPEIICGEIRKEDFQNYCQNRNYSGYLGPSEYRNLIIPLCEEYKIEFKPIDWFENDMRKLSYFDGKTQFQIDEFNKNFDEVMKRYFKSAQESEIPFNSHKFNSVVKEKQRVQEKLNFEVHQEYWIKRNMLIVEKLKEIISKYQDKRVLCVFGAEHVYEIYDKIQACEIKVVFPLK